MSRVAPQPDLFAPPAAPAPPPPDPIAELSAQLARLRAMPAPPWRTASAAMAEEHHALGLARHAGPQAEALAAAILRETERLLAMTD
ncbi:MAG: hypothetical protein KGL52_12815 [Rhodospirillales bacterium]|jgi:hypothetical protein|nr:hypothetical protein [Rhodospirillales bacterium]